MFLTAVKKKFLIILLFVRQSYNMGNLFNCKITNICELNDYECNNEFFPLHIILITWRVNTIMGTHVQFGAVQ